MCLAKGLQGSPGGRPASSGKDNASPDPEEQILTSFDTVDFSLAVKCAKLKSTGILINMWISYRYKENTIQFNYLIAGKYHQNNGVMFMLFCLFMVDKFWVKAFIKPCHPVRNHEFLHSSEEGFTEVWRLCWFTSAQLEVKDVHFVMYRAFVKCIHVVESALSECESGTGHCFCCQWKLSFVIYVIHTPSLLHSELYYVMLIHI